MDLHYEIRLRIRQVPLNEFLLCPLRLNAVSSPGRPDLRIDLLLPPIADTDGVIRAPGYDVLVFMMLMNLVLLMG